MKIAALHSILLALVIAPSPASGECPNACSGHGKCGARDACACFKNWMGNDCSDRICPFAHAFVDTPKGDLDASGGALSPPSSDRLVRGDEMYPEGTTEQYPNADANEGHFYMECSNKGLCDRKTGDCDCFDGYGGHACARTLCPNSCSGHGTCETIQELAEMGTFDTTAQHAASTTDFMYTYDLWDHEKTVGCKCDPGYFGYDCAQRKCKYGVDPLFESEGERVAAEFRVMTDAISGSFKLKVFDVFGEDYVTIDISVDATADEFCQAIDFLGTHSPEQSYGVFNMDRTPDSTRGTFGVSTDYYTCDNDHTHTRACCGKDGQGDFFVYFHNNPGPLKTPEFFSNDPTEDKLVGESYKFVGHTSFVPGEFVDYFGTKLDLGSQLLAGSTPPLSSYGLNSLVCSDASSCTSQISQLGISFPALMKAANYILVVSSFYSGTFNLLEPVSSHPNLRSAVEIMSAPYLYFGSATLTQIANGINKVIYAPYSSDAANQWYYFGVSSVGLSKEDKFIWMDTLYTVYKVTETNDGLGNSDSYQATIKTVENFHGSGTGSGYAHKVILNDDASNYEYVTQCSNRGICDTSSGLCKCFTGFHMDNCNTQRGFGI